MKATYWQKGDTLDYKNTGSAKIEHDTVVVLGKRIGVSGTEIPVGAVGSIHVTGVFVMNKAAEVISFGDDLYYDSENEVVTKTETEVKAGYAAESKDSAESKVLVKID
ncbi:DUF2190 family protein [Anaerocolumna sp. AGMB13020]|uniref:DUF2190 family protein n=1 Tax=Anaerocolumna sp. AGMB13020 TaxID=3081750 RepID=UPI0029540502|nr:DUF2190 family protein [Anaerocolumna sp. AGMB13020]WOO34942.1 DUF2190 family protein [Anaerocolumna sp. AGMB13020]